MDQTLSYSKQIVDVELSIGDWAKVIAAVGLGHLDLAEKERINSRIYDAVLTHS
jgi:hypothetical protein